jgi:hypothetical protein
VVVVTVWGYKVVVVTVWGYKVVVVTKSGDINWWL